MTRFFMTIHDAVNLVFKAAALMRDREIFILKMPAVKIMDLAKAVLAAEKDRNNKLKDINIKIIGKKNGERMHEKLLTEEEAENLWGLFVPFQGYGFNKAHAASYGIVSYQTAYLKANYPVEYMTALLTAESGDTEKIVEAIDECRRLKIKVLSPDINYSDSNFSIDNDTIRFGLSGIKNVGQVAIDIILHSRGDGLFLSLTDFCLRVDSQKVNRKVLESLIFLPTMFVGLMMPFFSRFFVQSLEKFKASVFFTQKIFLIFACPLVLGGVFLSRRIILFLAGEQFVPAAWTLSILMMAVGVIFFGALYSSVLIAINRQKKLTLIYGLGAVVNLGLNFVFIPRYSYNGAALTILFTELLVTLLMLYFFKQALKFVPSFRSFGSVLPALLLMLAVLVFLKEAPLLWLILLAGAVYFLGLWLFRGITKKELLFLAEAE